MTAITYKKGAAVSVSLTVAGKVFSFISSLLLAYYFGAGSATDVYFYLILISALLNGWLQNINISIIVPEFMHINSKSPQEARAFVNYFLYLYLICAALICAVCFILPAQSLGFISAFSDWQIEQSLNLMGLAALYFTSFFIMTFLISVTECFKLFSVYFLGPLNTLLPLALLLIFRKLEVMFIGYILAYVLQIAACLWLLKKHQAWQFNFSKPVFGKKFKQNILFFQPNNVAWAAVMYAPLFMVSSTSAGMVSAVNYSRMLADSPVDIFVSKVANISKVKLTTQAAQNDWPAMRDTLVRTDIVLMFLLLPFCVFSAVFARDIIELFFMRGNFTQQAANDTAIFLIFSILAVPFFSLNNNMNNLFSAVRLVKEITARYFIFTVIFIFLFVAGIKMFGAFAYPVVFLMLYGGRTILNIITAKQFCPQLRYAEHIMYLLKLAAVAFACALVTKFLFPSHACTAFGRILLNGSFFVCLCGLVLVVLGDVKRFINVLNIKSVRLM